MSDRAALGFRSHAEHKRMLNSSKPTPPQPMFNTVRLTCPERLVADLVAYLNGLVGFLILRQLRSQIELE